jgi:vacuolar-type H+-ATPase subunit I/STV1
MANEAVQKMTDAGVGQQVLEYLKTVGDFTSAHAPDVAKQFLHFHAVENWVNLGIAVGFFLLMLGTIVAIWVAARKDIFDDVVAPILLTALCLLFMFICSCGIFEYGMELYKIYYAPKLAILEGLLGK